MDVSARASHIWENALVYSDGCQACTLYCSALDTSEVEDILSLNRRRQIDRLEK